MGLASTDARQPGVLYLATRGLNSAREMRRLKSASLIGVDRAGRGVGPTSGITVKRSPRAAARRW